MNTAPFHHKKPFDPSGDVYANSVTRTMKSQSLSAWDMFTRETLQNSWDARDQTSHDDGVTFAIDYRDLEPDQIATLRNDVFGNDFIGIPSLENAFRGDSLSALCVSDAGTYGLRGPSRATSASQGPTDFNSFVRNIGRSDSKKLAGGTYGFGKGVFYIVSEANTIVVYTRTVDENNRPVSRLIAMANSDDFHYNGVAYTGRHWWGERAFEDTGKDHTEFAEPFVGEHADALAERLGLDTHFSDDRPSGTSIMVLSPDMSTDAPVPSDGSATETVMQQISRSLTRWAWPHMLSIDTGLDPIEFRVNHNGSEVPLVNPQSDKALSKFVEAFVEAISAQNPTVNEWDKHFRGRITTLAGKKPKKTLGILSTINLHSPVEESETIVEETISHHIATIRNPRMVVEYYPASVSPDGAAYCGVFIADPEADKIFARSEPAAHHQWNPETIAHDYDLLREFWKSTNNPVRVFQTRLKELTRKIELAGPNASKARHFKATSQLADSFGSLIANAQGGSGARTKFKQPKKKPTGKPTQSRNKASTDITVAGLKNIDGQTICTFKVDVSVPKRLLPAELFFKPTVDSDRGNIFDRLVEVGADTPYIQSIASDAGESELLIETDSDWTSKVLSETDTTFYVKVYQPASTAVSLNTDFEYQIGTDEEEADDVEAN
ncbi:hypothetical protein [uncultured Corynebacterium sp.]|uniref:hypothetical protein n=1 Tax=uncultured Corynebacterium sp. TaxID=159447 RepID=UPI0025FC074F|nr:hypothetical protein [uncultured Corynebacterium sp.]